MLIETENLLEIDFIKGYVNDYFTDKLIYQKSFNH